MVESRAVVILGTRLAPTGNQSHAFYAHPPMSWSLFPEDSHHLLYYLGPEGLHLLPLLLLLPQSNKQQRILTIDF